jgi:hypothetical protein
MRIAVRPRLVLTCHRRPFKYARFFRRIVHIAHNESPFKNERGEHGGRSETFVNRDLKMPPIAQIGSVVTAP